MLEDCSVTGSDFVHERVRKFSILTVFHYRRFSVCGPKIQLENDILRRQIQILAQNWCQEVRDIMAVMFCCGVLSSKPLARKLFTRNSLVLTCNLALNRKCVGEVRGDQYCSQGSVVVSEVSRYPFSFRLPDFNGVFFLFAPSRPPELLNK